MFCVLVRQEDLPKSEDDQSNAASDDSSDYVSALPWVQSSTTDKAHAEGEKASSVQDRTNPIETQKHILGLRASMQHLEGGRVIEEVPAEGRYNVDRDHEVEATSPLD